MTFLFALLAFFALTACSQDGSSSSQEEEVVEFFGDSLDGMVRITKNQVQVTLGTNDEDAKPTERPAMKVTLDYLFSFSKHEVTCGEYNALVKKFSGVKVDCDNDSLPATDITYYDAVLFANAKSKSDHLDTAYTYSKARFDGAGHCTELDGFSFHPEKSAYRLPTEAEWLFAASKSWSLDKAWTSKNSDYKAHPVCTGDQAAGLCDMVGNVMEWVNDWMGNFSNTTVKNYVGAPDGGNLGQRVLKGGSFRNDPSSIATYRRGDIYTVTSSTRSNYVGFRLAFGPIANATWMGSDGDSGESRITPLADPATIVSVLRTPRTRLAFRNDVTGNIAFIGYNEGRPKVVEIVDTIDAYHPEISPDGQRVAFCTGLEGSPSKSSVYVRYLNTEGTGLVRLDVDNAAIPRWKVLDNGDTVIVYVTSAADNSDDSEFSKKSTWQVKFSGDKFGTPKKLFDGAYHGGVSDDASFAVSGSKLLRARVGGADTVWYGGEQACNASLAKDGSNRTLFLDFGGQTGRDYVGKDYKTHERILVVDSTGKLIKSVSAPKGYQFDHTEWVDGSFAVATLTNANGSHRKIVLVDMANKKVTELVEGDELWHPSLWSDANKVDVSKLDADSAAYYFTGIESKLISHKMNGFWTIRDSIEIIGLGSSRMSIGFAAPYVKSGFAYDMATVPCDMNVSYFLANNYVLPHCSNLKILVVGIDLDLWKEKENTNVDLNLESNPGYFYDKSHDYWRDGFQEGFIELNEVYCKSSERILALTLSKGWGAQERGSWTNGGFSPNVFEGDSTWSDNSETYKINLNKLKKLIELAKERDIVVVGLVFPQSPYYKKTGAFGRHGMRRSLAQKLLKQIEGWTKDYSNFIFMDENKMGDHDYDDDMAFDYDHLSGDGAIYLTQKLDTLFAQILKGERP